MSEVWHVAHEIAWLIGWVVIGLLVVAAYFKIGIRVAKSIHVFNVASSGVRLVLTAAWPLIAFVQLLAWSIKRVASILVRLQVMAVEAVSGDVPAPSVPAADARPPPKLNAAYRTPSKEERVRELFAQRRVIDEELNKLLASESKAGGPKSLSN